MARESNGGFPSKRVASTELRSRLVLRFMKAFVAIGQSNRLRKCAKAWWVATLGAVLLGWGAARVQAISFPPTASEPFGALHFPGVNQYVEVGALAEFNVTTGLTVEAWVNFDAFDTSDR